MLSLLICLTFECTGCGNPIESTLQCEGQGVADQGGATIKLACPCCATKNQVIFTPDGVLHGVFRSRSYVGIPEPSIN